MKKDDVKIGGTYLAKVSDKVVPVRIDAANARGGWDATNLSSNRKIHIKSPAKLRGPAPDRQASQRVRAVAEAQAADAAANAHAVPAQIASPAKVNKQAGEAKPRKVSGLDAAYEVLKAKGEPMACKAIIDEILAKGMWKTGGKTPAATIYSAMVREIDSKPGESRFKKIDRGLFTVATPHN